MNRKQALLTASTLFAVLLPALGILLGDRWWSINHLRFLPLEFVAGYAVALVLISLIATNRFELQCALGIDRVDNFLFRPFGPRLLTLGVVFAALFVVFRCQTYFLGDGYTLAGLFAMGTDSIQKPTEWGSTVIIWMVQSLFGEASRQTSETAIQAISIASGLTSLALFRAIATRVGNTPATRVLCFGTLIGGGWMLLFFGYIEFYPLLWVAALAFIWTTLKFLQTGRGFIWAILFFIVSCLMHLQAVFFLGGLLYVIAIRIKLPNAAINRYFWPGILTGIALVIATIAWLYRRDIAYELTFLPLFTGRPNSPEYAILSPFHFGDIAQLILLLVPTIVPLLIFRIVSENTRTCDPVQRFLTASSIGSGMFLLVIDPFLGLGRDWDLFSLTLLSPTLLVLHCIRCFTFDRTKRLIMGTVLSGLIITGLFIAVSVRITSAENRFYKLLQNYGTKERNGWVILGVYLNDTGKLDMAKVVKSEMNSRFPDYVELNRGFKLLESGKIADADRIAATLVAHNPYDPNFLVLKANVAGDKGVFDSSLALYRRALAIGPYRAPVWNELGQLYLIMKQYDSAAAIFHRGWRIGRGSTNILEGLALAHFYRDYLDSALLIADSLRGRDPHSPGASLVQMAVALKVGDTATANRYFLDFQTYGTERSDYEKVIRHFREYLRE